MAALKAVPQAFNSSQTQPLKLPQSVFRFRNLQFPRWVRRIARVQIKSQLNCRRIIQQWLIDFLQMELRTALKEVQPFKPQPQRSNSSTPLRLGMGAAAAAAAAASMSQRLINVTDICQVGFHNFVRTLPSLLGQCTVGKKQILN